MNSESQATKQYVLDFKAQSRLDAEALMNKELEKLLSTASPEMKNKCEKEFEGFRELFSRYLDEAKTSVNWEKIQPPPQGIIGDYASIENKELFGIKEILDRLVVIKLNGGLGTSMGCTGAKSLISVRSDLTFLDMNIQQIEHLNSTYGVNVPLVLMNSFNTDEETNKTVRKYKNINVAIHCFNQSRHPRIVKESLTPLPKNMTDQDKEWWYPPGHGDVYEAINNSGLLDKFVAEGRDIAFISNIDNLGATVDLHILDHIARPPEGKPIEFIMEVTDKTRADVKGGTLINYEDKLTLLEIAQVPDEHVDDFKSVTKFKIFNTNNLWINLLAVKRLLKAKQLNKEIIVNNKTLPGGLKVIQLETAVGAAIKNFQGAKGINVPRSRFLPVKKTSDLLIVMSNLYKMAKGTLLMSDLRQFKTVPIVQLSGPFFKNVKDFLSRFASIPDLLELDHLTVSGDVTFGRNVSLKGTVIVIANHGERIDIPSGSVLENKIVSGNLRILDH